MLEACRTAQLLQRLLYSMSHKQHFREHSQVATFRDYCQ